MSALVVALVIPGEPLRLPLARALAAAGYVPVEATSVEELPSRLGGRSPVALVLDLVSPSATPDVLVGAARAALGEELLLVGLTSFYSAGADHGAWTTHVTSFLPRPAAPADLLATLRDFLDPAVDAPPPRRRILLADDDAIALRLSARLFELRGFQVILARDGNEALAQALAHRPDAVVTDILMPGLDGYHLCMAIRKTPALATLPVLLLTGAFDEPADGRLASTAGATAFVVKTASLTEVFTALDQALATPAAVVPLPEAEAVERGWSDRAHRQLLRLAARDMEHARRSALREAELSVLARIADAFAERRSLRSALAEVLGLVAERGELTFVLLYLPGSAGDLQPQGMAGNFADGERTMPPTERMDRLLRRAIEAGEPLVLPEADTPDGAGLAALAAFRVSSLLLTPLRLQGRTLGVLVFAAEQRDLSTAPWRAYAQTVGLHLAHAISLYRLASSAPPTDRAVTRERLAHDLQGLVTLLDAVLPGDAAARAHLPALTAGRPGRIDLREPLRGAFPTFTHPTELPSEGVASALAAAFLLVRDVIVGTGELTRLTVLDTDGAWTVGVTAAGGVAGDAPLLPLAGEIVRRHGGELRERPSPAGHRSLVVRLPRGD